MFQFVHSKFIQAGVLSAVFTAFIFLMHVYPGFNSMLNLDVWPYANPSKALNQEYLAEVVEYHKQEYSFSRRVLTTALIEQVNKYSGQGIARSFVIVNYFFIWVCGMVVFFSSRLVLKSTRFASFSLVLFMLSFPVVFAFFPTIYSYDDPLQYTFLALTVLMIIRRKWWISALFFAGAVWSRETSFLLLPAFVVLAKKTPDEKNIYPWIARVVPFVVVVLMYLLYSREQGDAAVGTALTHDFKRRFQVWHFNFQNAQFAMESVFSALMVLLLAAVSFLKSGLYKHLHRAFWISMVINTVFVFLFAQARESRLFLLPLFFWFPVSAERVGNLARPLIEAWRLKNLWALLPSFFSGAIISYGVFRLYQSTAVRASDNLFHEYLFVLLTFVISTLCVQIITRFQHKL